MSTTTVKIINLTKILHNNFFLRFRIKKIHILDSYNYLCTQSNDPGIICMFLILGKIHLSILNSYYNHNRHHNLNILVLNTSYTLCIFYRYHKTRNNLSMFCNLFNHNIYNQFSIKNKSILWCNNNHLNILNKNFMNNYYSHLRGISRQYLVINKDPRKIYNYFYFNIRMFYNFNCNQQSRVLI